MAYKLNFCLRRIITEDHKPSQIYCTRFCDSVHSYSSYFSSVGANTLSVYRIDDDGSVSIVQVYLDEDSEEIFYSCAWSANKALEPLLVVSGLRGILKVINCKTFVLEGVLFGHGNAVNDIRVHPLDDDLVLSASKDESIRLWNITTYSCIAIFAGEKGHRDEILSIHFHPLGNCFVSSGMDTSIKIWNLEDPLIQNAIQTSYTTPRLNNNLPMKPHVQQVPIFSTTQVHNDYVDSVCWVGNFLLSKSTKNRVALWSPDVHRYKTAPLILREFVIADSNLWYVRLDVCPILDIFGVGNKDGKVFVFKISEDEIDSETVDDSVKSSLGRPNLSNLGNSTETVEIKEIFETECPCHPDAIVFNNKCNSTVRQVAFHPDGHYMIYSCDNGSIYVWEIICQPTTIE